jgi:hypothetical protein
MRKRKEKICIHFLCILFLRVVASATDRYALLYSISDSEEGRERMDQGRQE